MNGFDLIFYHPDQGIHFCTSAPVGNILQPFSGHLPYDVETKITRCGILFAKVAKGKAPIAYRQSPRVNSRPGKATVSLVSLLPGC